MAGERAQGLTNVNNKEPGRRMKIVAISGSLREGSFNSALLRAARELAPANLEITLLDLNGVPLYDGDVEARGDPVTVTALKQAIRDADGVLLATPEYNGGTSGVLKNAVDWASRDRGVGSIRGKPIAIVGAGGRGGTVSAQRQLRDTLGSVGAAVMDEPHVFVGGAWDRFDSEGRLHDENTRTSLGALLAAFADWIEDLGEAQAVHAA